MFKTLSLLNLTNHFAVCLEKELQEEAIRQRHACNRQNMIKRDVYSEFQQVFPSKFSYCCNRLFNLFIGIVRSSKTICAKASINNV